MALLLAAAAFGGVGCSSCDKASAPLSAEDTSSTSGEADGGFVHPDVGSVADPVAEPPISAEEREKRRLQALAVQKERTHLHMLRVSKAIDKYAIEQRKPALPVRLYDLVEPKGTRDAFLERSDITDGWGNDLILVPGEGVSYGLRSVGSDNAYGGEDDIVETYEIGKGGER